VRALAAALVLLALAAGCAPGGDERPVLRVSAAASLKDALTAYGAGFSGASVRLSFAGSDELAAQIRQGARPDVFAAANTALPGELAAAGLVEQPMVVARNRLVLAVPAGSAIATTADAARPGTTVAMGAEGVPVGDYARALLKRLPAGQGRAILANVRSNEPDVKGVVGKLTQGAVDAGFVYASDVKAAAGRLEAIALPAELSPSIGYAVAVVKGARAPRQAQAFVDGLLAGAGRRALLDAGFEPPGDGSGWSPAP
jgi:molybdate transport system substrate-binding protein